MPDENEVMSEECCEWCGTRAGVVIDGFHAECRKADDKYRRGE
jgi:hypothetical protein